MALKLKTALRGKEFISAITERSVKPKSNKKVPSLIVSTFVDNSLRVAYDCKLDNDL